MDLFKHALLGINESTDGASKGKYFIFIDDSGYLRGKLTA